MFSSSRLIQQTIMTLIHVKLVALNRQVEILKINILVDCVDLFLFSAIAYPSSQIYVMLLTLTNSVRLKNTKIIKALKTYENVNFRYLNALLFSKNTPLEAWLKTGQLEQSAYVVPHTSDVFRFLTLWKYGGLYLDLDVVTTKGLKHKNFICKEQLEFMNGAVLGLDTTLGRKFSALCLKYVKSPNCPLTIINVCTCVDLKHFLRHIFDN